MDQNLSPITYSTMLLDGTSEYVVDFYTMCKVSQKFCEKVKDSSDINKIQLPGGSPCFKQYVQICHGETATLTLRDLYDVLLTSDYMKSFEISQKIKETLSIQKDYRKHIQVFYEQLEKYQELIKNIDNFSLIDLISPNFRDFYNTTEFIEKVNPIIAKKILLSAECVYPTNLELNNFILKYIKKYGKDAQPLVRFIIPSILTIEQHSEILNHFTGIPAPTIIKHTAISAKSSIKIRILAQKYFENKSNELKERQNIVRESVSDYEFKRQMAEIESKIRAEKEKLEAKRRELNDPKQKELINTLEKEIEEIECKAEAIKNSDYLFNEEGLNSDQIREKCRVCNSVYEKLNKITEDFEVKEEEMDKDLICFINTRRDYITALKEKAERESISFEEARQRAIEEAEKAELEQTAKLEEAQNASPENISSEAENNQSAEQQEGEDDSTNQIQSDEGF